MRTLLLLATLAIAGCPKSKQSEAENRLGAPQVAVDAAPSPKPYAPAGVPVEVRALHGKLPIAPPGTTWPDEIHSADEFDALIAGDLPRGPIATIVRERASPEQLDDGSVDYSGVGTLGMEAGRMIGFVDPPPLLKGEMPLGGRVSMHGEGAIIVKWPPAAAASLTPQFVLQLEQHVLLELVEVRDFDGVDWIYARLLGYRLVDPAKREVIYDSLAARP
jgi:hypothetical protein